MDDQRLHEKQISDATVVLSEGVRRDVPQLSVGPAASGMALGDERESASSRVRVVEVDAKGHEFLKDVQWRLAIVDAVTSSNVPYRRACSVRRNGDNDVLVGRNGPVGVGALVEKEGVDRERGCTESASRHAIEVQFAENVT